MNHKFGVCFFLLSVGVLSAGCEPEPRKPPPLELDNSYLESRTYQEFSRKLEEESQRRSDERELINCAVHVVLSQTDRHLELPATFTTETVAPYTGANRRILLRSQGLTSSAFSEYSYYPVGTVKRGEMTVLFFLLRRNNTPSIDMDLMAATIMGSGMVQDARSLAPYRRSIQRRTRSEVEISADLEILCVVRDSGGGPIEDESVRYVRYAITGEGRILEDPPLDE